MIKFITAAAILSFPLALEGLADEVSSATTKTCTQTKFEEKSFHTICRPQNNPNNMSFLVSGSFDSEGQLITPRKIDIRRDDKTIQELRFNNDEDADSISVSQTDDIINFIDIDFDGNLDIQLHTAESAGPNQGYDYWLYDSTKSIFEKFNDDNYALSGSGITTDEKTKTITTSSRSSCCMWNESKYYWQDKKLITKEVNSYGLVSLRDIKILNEQLSGYICSERYDSYTNGILTSTKIVDGSADFCEKGEGEIQMQDIKIHLGNSGNGYTASYKTDKGKITELTITYSGTKTY